jgi:Dit-like tail protein
MSQAVAIIRQIGGLVFDATFSEEHEIEAEVTENPVETGVSVADHMFMLPIRLNISAGVSDITLHPNASDQFTGGSSRSRKAYDLLTALQATFEPFSVQTGLKLYQNMVCKKVTPRQDKDSNFAFIFDAILREVIMVSTQAVTVPPRAAGATSRQAGAVVQRGTVQSAFITDPVAQQKVMEVFDPDIAAAIGGGG